MLAIKNFEMPKDCDSCPFYDYHNDSEDTCKITGEGLYHVNLGEYHKRCPLVDINIDDIDEQDSILDKIKEEIQDNTYFINEVTEKEGIDFETVEKIIDKYRTGGR